MTETRDIVLGGKTFAVPLLPLRHNRVVYPLCRDLSADGEDSLMARLIAAQGKVEAVRDDEWPKLIDIAFHGAAAADKDLTREAFDDMPVTMPQLLDAFFIVRLQTGVWLAQPASDAADEASAADASGEASSGEESGADSPLP